MHRSIPIIEREKKKTQNTIAWSLIALCLVAFRPSIQEWNDESDNLTMLWLPVLTDYFFVSLKSFATAFCSWLTPTYNQWRPWATFSTNLRNKLSFGDVCWNNQKYLRAAECGRLLLSFHDCSLANQCAAFSFDSLSRIQLLDATNPSRKNDNTNLKKQKLTPTSDFSLLFFIVYLII